LRHFVGRVDVIRKLRLFRPFEFVKGSYRKVFRTSVYYQHRALTSNKMPPSKPVTLLKRGAPIPPAPQVTAVAYTPAPPVLAERVADAVRTAVDGALTRERARLDAAYRAREEALLRVVADIIQNSLRDVVAKAAAREADALATAVRNIASRSAISKKSEQSAGGKQGGRKSKQATAEEKAAACRAAFKAAFEKELLGSIEESMQRMMKNLSKAVDSELDTALAVPIAQSSTKIRTAADSVREQASELALIASSSENVFADSSTLLKGDGLERGTPRQTADDKIRADLDTMFEEGRIRDAIVLAMHCTPEVQAEAMSGILESTSVTPEEVILTADDSGEGAISPDILIQFMAALARDINDSTSERLTWIYEAALAVQDAVLRGSGPDSSKSDAHILLLSATTNSLKQVTAGGNVSDSDAKLAKLLVKAVDSSIRTLQR
jgi:hypothetical protein